MFFGSNSVSDSVMAHVAQTPNFNMASANVQGRRSNNEDEDDFILGERYSLFAIYDGHGGDSCSKYLKKHLLKELNKLEVLNRESIIKLYEKIDFDYRNILPSSGSTAVVSILDNYDNKVMFINLGDSRAMLVKKGIPVFETVDHTPKLESERLRILGAGYYIAYDRILGSLSVSKSFGDYAFKGSPYDINSFGVGIIPDISDWLPLESDDLIILNCDGLNESGISNNNIALYINEHLKKSKNILDTVLSTISETLSNSMDNISLMVIKINEQIIPESPIDFQKFYIPGITNKLGIEEVRKESFIETAKKNDLNFEEALERRKSDLKKLLEGTLSPPVHHYIVSRIKKEENGDSEIESLRKELDQLCNQNWITSLFENRKEDDRKEDIVLQLPDHIYRRIPPRVVPQETKNIPIPPPNFKMMKKPHPRNKHL